MSQSGAQLADLLGLIARELQTPLLHPAADGLARWMTSIVVRCADLPPTLGSAPCLEISEDRLSFAAARALPHGPAEVEFEDLPERPTSPIEILDCEAVTEGIYQITARFV